MDRRQKKTRDAIFQAFSKLLEKKRYENITVQEIIDEANVGRTTFYAHFETNDYLLKALCEELFRHIIDTAIGLPHEHYHYSCGSEADSVFLHLLRHLQENDSNILALLSSQNNEIFLRYFKSNLKDLIIRQYVDKEMISKKQTTGGLFDQSHFFLVRRNGELVGIKEPERNTCRNYKLFFDRYTVCHM